MEGVLLKHALRHEATAPAPTTTDTNPAQESDKFDKLHSRLVMEAVTATKLVIETKGGGQSKDFCVGKGSSWHGLSSSQTQHNHGSFSSTWQSKKGSDKEEQAPASGKHERDVL